MAAGIRQRHGTNCRGGRCQCSWEAFVYSKRDGKKIRKTFPTQAAASAWRQESTVAVRRMLMRAPTALTVAQAVETWLQGAREGWIRNRSGDQYKPAAIRAYETGWRVRVKPALGAMRLSDVTRNDVQDLIDSLVAEGWNASTVVVTIASLQVVYKRALVRGEIAVNPAMGLQMPAVRGGRIRIATPKECTRTARCASCARPVAVGHGDVRGARRGELMALRVEDINLDRGVIHVRRGWDTLEGEITPKSGRERTVPINTVLRGYLETHLLGARPGRRVWCSV